MTAPIPLARPEITAEERRLVDEVLSSAALSRGPMVRAFEAAMAEYVGSAHAVAVSSGSAALHLALKALDLPADAEVITSPFGVPATPNMILAAGARVRFADIRADSLALDPAAVREAISSQTTAVIPVHVYGQPAPLDGLLEVCQPSHLALVEDACEALGTRLDGRHLGTFGRVGCFGFYPNKQLTTGEGGVLVTDDDALAHRLRRLRNHGREMDGRWLDQEEPGLNYRLPELSAALGLGQIRRFDEIAERRAAAAARYRQRLSDVPGLEVPPALDHVCWFSWVVQLKNAALRDPLAGLLAADGIQTGRYFAPLHQQPGLQSRVPPDARFPVTERVAARVLALPLFNTISAQQIDRVCDRLTHHLTALGAAGS
ncbi:MAG: DegT/DnrJ/EryC1/StrS family aminotransferase [Pseudomonadota bacterium]